MTDLVRVRRPSDVPTLVEVLAEQQPASRYPFRWPLPFPPEQFVVRPHERVAWCATRDGMPVGHVCVQEVDGSATTNGIDADTLTRAWSTGHGRTPSELAVISSLFTATRVRGSGLGGRLLDAAVGWIREQGLSPCLDVLQGPSPALALYLARGWVVAGEARPSWLPDGMPPVLALVLPERQ